MLNNIPHFAVTIDPDSGLVKRIAYTGGSLHSFVLLRRLKSLRSRRLCRVDVYLVDARRRSLFWVSAARI